MLMLIYDVFFFSGSLVARMLLSRDVLNSVRINRSLNRAVDQLVKVRKLNSLVNALLSGVVPIGDILGKIPVGAREDRQKAVARLRSFWTIVLEDQHILKASFEEKIN